MSASRRKPLTRRLKIDRPIALVGMMGAGKTTVGRRLAAALDLPFFDADAEIVMFSPQHEHSQVIDHMVQMTKG